ncbi:hypothetical protein C7C56_000770 [Massilia glaciei]|uniref:Uncharacterized protein n=2 Tax=Massilia glaciei TaxID=1524097 RepID=A0A2U2I7B1_9BURK|nr:hypothetical protein C7C56_000770 [Massilia glaciei]
MQMMVAVAISGAASYALATSASFSMPSFGAAESSPYKVRFAVDGMEVTPAAQFIVTTGQQELLLEPARDEAAQSCPRPEQPVIVLLR